MENITEFYILEQLNNDIISKAGVTIGTIAFVIFTGLIGNAVSIIFYGFESRKSTTNFFITSLAATDLTACVGCSLIIVQMCYALTFTNKSACKFIVFSLHWIVSLSAFMLVVICADRYRKVCRPFQWQFTFLKAKMCIVGTIGLACFTSAKTLVIVDIVNINVTDPKTRKQVEALCCMRSTSPSLEAFVKISDLFDFVLAACIFLYVCVTYTIIARTLWKQTKTTKQFNTDHPVNIIRTIPARPVLQSSTGAMVSVDKAQEGSTAPIATHLPENVDGYEHRTVNHESQIEETRECETTFALKVKANKDVDRERTQNANKESDCETMDKTSNSRSEPVEPNKINNSRRNRIEQNVTIMLIVSTISSIVCFVPYFIVVNNVSRFYTVSTTNFGVQLAMRSYVLKHAINPLILGVFNTAYRRFVKKQFSQFLLLVCSATKFCRKSD